MKRGTWAGSGSTQALVRNTCAGLIHDSPPLAKEAHKYTTISKVLQIWKRYHRRLCPDLWKLSALSTARLTHADCWQRHTFFFFCSANKVEKHCTELLYAFWWRGLLKADWLISIYLLFFWIWSVIWKNNMRWDCLGPVTCEHHEIFLLHFFFTLQI